MSWWESININNLKRAGKQIVNDIGDVFNIESAYAPVDHDMNNYPIVERPQQTEQLQNETARLYNYTPEGLDAIKKVPVRYAPFDQSSLGYYRPKQGDITLQPKGINPETLTHEFTHSIGEELGNQPHQQFNNEPLIDIPEQVDKWWDKRKRAWGNDYMSNPFMEYGERQATFGTEIPSRYMSPEMQAYYEPYYQAGYLPEINLRNSGYDLSPDINRMSQGALLMPRNPFGGRR